MTDEQTKTPSPVATKKKMPLWFKVVAGIAVLALVFVTGGILFTESLIDVIDNQLKALRKSEIRKAYDDYTSKEFQAFTSFEQFEEFLKAYPIFIHNQSSHFAKRSIHKNRVTLVGNLTSTDHVKFPVEYKLIKEDGKWKIFSIHLLSASSGAYFPETVRSEDLTEVAQTVLDEIKKGDISTVYRQYTSKEFQEATSEQDFNDFVRRYPLLGQFGTVSFHNPSVHEEGISTLSAVITQDDLDAFLKFYFVYEDNTWKVLSLRILSPTEDWPEPQSGKSTLEIK